jgi:anti-sigma factor RsiW
MGRHVISYEKLIAFAASELDGHTSAEVARHVASCERCTKTVTLFRAIQALFRSDCYWAPSITVLARVRGLFSMRRT